MRFFKLLRFDICNGIIQRAKVYAFLIVFTLLAFVDFSVRFEEVRAGGHYGAGQRSFGAFLFYLFGGMEKYEPSPENPFVFPALWVLVFSVILFITLYYPYEQLDCIGRYMLVAAGRRYWWFSKVIWNFCTTLLCFLTIFGSGLLFTVISGGQTELLVNPVVNGLYPRIMWMIEPAQVDLSYNLLFAPILTAFALSLFQMALSLWIKPLYSFLNSVAVLIASAYYLSPILIGNYAMAVRSELISFDSVKATNGFWICLFIVLISTAVGSWRFERFDVLSRIDR